MSPHPSVEAVHEITIPRTWLQSTCGTMYVYCCTYVATHTAAPIKPVFQLWHFVVVSGGRQLISDLAWAT